MNDNLVFGLVGQENNMTFLYKLSMVQWKLINVKKI
jgi:hypothetical protein